MKIQSEESEEMARFKELFPDMKSPDSFYDKSLVGFKFDSGTVKHFDVNKEWNWKCRLSYQFLD